MLAASKGKNTYEGHVKKIQKQIHKLLRKVLASPTRCIDLYELDPGLSELIFPIHRSTKAIHQEVMAKCYPSVEEK